MTDNRLEKLLAKLPEHLRPDFDGSAARGYYDKEKCKKTAAADIMHAANR
jgi:hypothetical protein